MEFKYKIKYSDTVEYYILENDGNRLCQLIRWNGQYGDRYMFRIPNGKVMWRNTDIFFPSVDQNLLDQVKEAYGG